MKTLKFKDLTPYEINLIKSMANDQLINKPGWNPSKCLMQSMLDFIHAKGFDIVESLDRKPTITGPLKSWYEPVTKVTNKLTITNKD